MAFNPSDITTDMKYGWGRSLWRKPPVKPALLDQCCESQLELIKYNFAKFDKKITKDSFWTTDEVEEFFMWQRMFNAIQKGANVDTTPRNDTLLMDIFVIQQVISRKLGDRARIVNATEIDLIVYLGDNTQMTRKISIGKEDSIFDEMTKCLEFDKWGSVMLRGRGVDVYLKENRPDGDSTREVTKQQINEDGRKMILEHQRKDDLLHFEIREPYIETKRVKKNRAVSDTQKEDEKIELRVFQAPIPGYYDTYSYRERSEITIPKSANSTSMFTQIGRCVDYEDWGVVKLTDGLRYVTLYEEKSTARHITMQPSPGVRGIEFDKDFRAEIEKFRGEGRVGKQVYLEIAKRFIPHTTTTPDEAGESHEAEANSLAARFQSITWV
jgi:hypothetical protein